MNSRLIICSLIWSCFCVSVFSIENSPNVRLPRSPQLPPFVSARQPSKNKSAIGIAVDNVQIEQKSSHRHPYLTRYEYNEDQTQSDKKGKEARKRSAMPYSPFIASRISVSEKKELLAADKKMHSKENHPPKKYFRKSFINKKGSSPERSIKEYLEPNKEYNDKKIPAISYQNVLNKINITDKEVRAILQRKGVIFEEFISFIIEGASMEQVQQILNVPDMENMKMMNNPNNESHIEELPVESQGLNLIPSVKTDKESDKNSIGKTYHPNALFDANALPSKDSPMIAHFRKPQIITQESSASIISLSVEEKEKFKSKQKVDLKSEKKFHPPKAANSIKSVDRYQSDQATVSSPPFRFEDGLRLFLIICGGIGGIILLVTVVLVIYNVLTCKESRMAQRNYELSKQIRKIDDTLEIC